MGERLAAAAAAAAAAAPAPAVLFTKDSSNFEKRGVHDIFLSWERSDGAAFLGMIDTVSFFQSSGHSRSE